MDTENFICTKVELTINGNKEVELKLYTDEDRSIMRGRVSLFVKKESEFFDHFEIGGEYDCRFGSIENV